VLLVWTAGTVRIPRGRRLWRPGGASKIELALELRSDARHHWHCRPEYVLFDAWDPAQRLLKRLRDSGWYGVGRLKQNRRFHGQGLRHHRRQPYRSEAGWLSGGLTVLAVRYGAKDDATHRLRVPAAEGRRLDHVRAQSEDVIRVREDQLALSGGQARSERAPPHHLACCLAAFWVPERERQDRHRRMYKLTHQLSCKGRSLVLPALERLRNST
jgi:hypothetical protein